MNYTHSANSSKAGHRHYRHPSRSSTGQKLWPSASGWLGLAVAAGSFLFTEPLPAATPVAWGYGINGQLGDGNFYPNYPFGVATPVQVSGLTTVTAIAGGGQHSLALNSDGTVWAWGGGSGGQSTVATPFQISGLTSVTAIACGGAHSLALNSDSTVWAWGSGIVGQLGDGNFYDTGYGGVVTPVHVINLTAVTAIAGGGGHSLALKSDGTAWAWGSGGSGQLGDGIFHSSGTIFDPLNPGVAAPIQVSGLTAVTALAGGQDHSLALKSDGTVWAWGDGLYGQLGDGNFYNNLPGGLGGVATPVQVIGLTSVTAIACGEYHSLALKSDGSVWAWGLGQLGRLGDGNFYTSPPYGVATPVQVIGLSGVVAIDGGQFHSLALKSDGTVWAWGGGFLGQLGDGNFYTDPSSGLGGVATPVQVIGLSAVVAIAAGGDHSLALPAVATNPPPVITSLTATPSVLRPITNRLTPVHLDVVVNDNGGSTTCNIISVTSSDPIIPLPSGNLEPYWFITGNLSLYLRAGRNTPGVARTYTITVECTDTAGNVSSKTVDVIVPK